MQAHSKPGTKKNIKQLTQQNGPIKEKKIKENSYASKLLNLSSFSSFVCNYDQPYGKEASSEAAKNGPILSPKKIGKLFLFCTKRHLHIDLWEKVTAFGKYIQACTLSVFRIIEATF